MSAVMASTDISHGFTSEILYQPGPSWERCERELSESGAPVPLPHRAAWVRIFPNDSYWFVAARNQAGLCRAGIGVSVARSRTLPSHLLLRVRRCVPGSEAGALESAI